MHTSTKKKLCWNCEGNVSHEAVNCPFCGVYLHHSSDDSYSNDNQSENTSFQSASSLSSPQALYQFKQTNVVAHEDKDEDITPPYIPVNQDLTNQKPSQLNSQSSPHANPLSQINKSQGKQQTKQMNISTNQKSLNPLVICISTLLGGSMLFLFGVMLFLFSQQGTFTLRWNANFWFIYMAISIPLLIVGWRFLNKIDEPT